MLFYEIGDTVCTVQLDKAFGPIIAPPFAVAAQERFEAFCGRRIKFAKRQRGNVLLRIEAGGAGDQNEEAAVPRRR